jgi:TetR/AcrR family tetracycline transcriptional repressor
MVTTSQPRQKLSRDKIVEAALRVMDAEGLEAVSMRRVAREVGAEAMSLYHHVADKDDLLQGVCDKIMASFEFPAAGGTWGERMRAAARSWRRLLQAHPDVMRLFALTHGPSPSSPDSLRPTEFALGLIRDAGITDRDTVQAFHAFGGYIQGFVMMEGGSIKGGGHDPDAHDVFVSDVDAAAFPVLHQVSHYFTECGADEQFEFGLDLMIRGLEARAAAAPDASSVAAQP